MMHALRLHYLVNEHKQQLDFNSSREKIGWSLNTSKSIFYSVCKTRVISSVDDGVDGGERKKNT